MATSVTSILLLVLVCVDALSSRQGRDVSRRHFSEAFVVVSVSAGTFSIISPWNVATADTGEAIRRGASNIPGYGPPDILFPASFVGRWAVAKQTNDQPVASFDMRFIPNIDGAAIQDRGYNLVKETSGTSNPIQSYEWSENNPNNLRVLMNDGTRIEIKVTKRSTDKTEDTVSSSEFTRVTTDSGGVPIIEARRTLRKWKVVSPNVVEGLEIVYDMGGNLRDPMAMSISSANKNTPGPQVISKSRLHLERIL